MADPAAVKATLRTEALARRAAMAPEARAAASNRAAARVRALIRPGEIVALFWPIRDEIDSRLLFPAVEEGGGRIVLPAIQGGRLVFRLHPGEARLEPGPLGTRHPPADSPERDPGLVVAPLVAFDRRGGRIGYGRGYYDGALSRLRASGQGVRIVGLAFACQEVDAVPMEPHDVALPAVATEDELIQIEQIEQIKDPS